MNGLGFERVESRELLAFGALDFTSLAVPTQTESVAKDEKITISGGRTESGFSHLLPHLEPESVWAVTVKDGTSNTILIGESL